MPAVKRSQSDLALINWTWTSEDDGAWSHGTLSVAAQCETARCLASIDATLQQIRGLIQQLWTDGIHELIRLEARNARRRERNSRTAAKRRRAKAENR